MKTVLKFIALTCGVLTGMVVACIASFIALVSYSWFDATSEEFMVGFVVTSMIIGGMLGGIAAYNLLVKRKKQ